MTADQRRDVDWRRGPPGWEIADSDTPDRVVLSRKKRRKKPKPLSASDLRDQMTFAAAKRAFVAAKEAEIGLVRILRPDDLKRAKRALPPPKRRKPKPKAK